MKIAFQTMEETVLPAFQGGEKALNAKMVNDGVNKILRGRLEPGASIGMHTHVTSSEIIYILEGAGKVLTLGGEERVSAGDCHYCPKGQAHSLVNDGETDLIFFAVVPEQ